MPTTGFSDATKEGCSRRRRHAASPRQRERYDNTSMLLLPSWPSATFGVIILVMAALVRGVTEESRSSRKMLASCSWNGVQIPTVFREGSTKPKLVCFHERLTFQRSIRVPRRLPTTTSAATIDDPVHLSHAEFSPTDLISAKDPVLFLHGLLGSKRNFASVAATLSATLAQPRRVLAFDLRNHGENSDWRSSMSYEEQARDVIATLDQLAIPKVVLVGHSMGGKVAKAAALLYPERVSGVVVLDMAPVRYDRETDASWNDVVSIIDVLSTIDVQQAKTKRDVDAALRSCGIVDPALRAFVLTNISTENPESLVWKVNLEAISSQLDVLADFQLGSLTYDGDVFFIHGSTSKFVKSSHLPVIHQYFPNYMLTSLRGVGHWIHAEAPDDTIALLRKYLDR